MAFFNYWIDLIGSFFTYSWYHYYFFPMIGLAFLASVPRIIRALFFWR